MKEQQAISRFSSDLRDRALRCQVSLRAVLWCSDVLTLLLGVVKPSRRLLAPATSRAHAHRGALHPPAHSEGSASLLVTPSPVTANQSQA